MIRMVAIDLGAESGRAVLGIFDGQRLSVQEVYRFPNIPVRVRDVLHWDILCLFHEIKEGLARAVRIMAGTITSVGVDTWGVDFALLDREGRLVGNPVHYRDRRTEGMMEAVFQRVPPEEIYNRTGIQFMPINTLYQLFSMVVREDPQLEIAHTFLTIPDLFHYWLSGTIVCEFTNATTTQCYDPIRKDWAWDLLERLGIPTRFFPEVRPPGTILGRVLPEVTEETGLTQTWVVAPASHDTGSAVAAVPFQHPDAAYISSGTWSLVGVEVREPVITEEARLYNFTNEGGVSGTFRLLKNVMGLWLLQECRRTWAKQAGKSIVEEAGGSSTLPSAWEYEALIRQAEGAPPLRSLIDPDDPRFLPPGDMPMRIQVFCQETGQPIPKAHGEIVRCILESLALKYRWVIERLERLLGRQIPMIHIVGGGSRNALLCQWTADATGRPVLAGPAEATAIGNLMVQAMALGYVGNLEEAREVIRRSFSPTVYTPRAEAKSMWADAYDRFVSQILSSRE
ncbi:rhamnulokinase family protein [Thermoflexus sp.]|uniref:rhamnulokinase n=1 Tax=Thermoflexus sp. TaxID=1969742 RepID=UPI0035E45F43